jgi:hypothetical protein
LQCTACNSLSHAAAGLAALPTFQNRIKYFMYDHSFIRSGAYLPGGNDGNRVLSYRAGWHLLKTQPAGRRCRRCICRNQCLVPGMCPTCSLPINCIRTASGCCTVAAPAGRVCLFLPRYAAAAFLPATGAPVVLAGAFGHGRRYVSCSTLAWRCSLAYSFMPFCCCGGGNGFGLKRKIRFYETALFDCDCL